MRDYTKTVINSLDEVRKREQLPPSGPGLIFIDVSAPPITANDVNSSLVMKFDEITKALSPKLTSDNTRVNAVVLTCTLPTRIEEQNKTRACSH